MDMSIRHLLPLFLVALVASPLAHAQYKWRDANGRLVYSDMPPPASVPQGAVLQAPNRPATPVAPVTDSGGTGMAAKAAAAPTAAASAPSMADRELEFRKRRMERADAERKATEEAARAKQAAAACDDARAQLRTLESGIRITRVTESGEREFLDDAQRAARLDAARASLSKHCTSS